MKLAYTPTNVIRKEGKKITAGRQKPVIFRKWWKGWIYTNKSKAKQELGRCFSPVSWGNLYFMWGHLFILMFLGYSLFQKICCLEGFLRTLSLRSSIGVVFQLCRISYYLFSCERWTKRLTPWSFTAVFVVNVIR